MENNSSDRRDPDHCPDPSMVWSDRHRMWVERDTRTPEEKKRHESIAAKQQSICGQEITSADRKKFLQKVHDSLLEAVEVAVLNRFTEMERDRGLFDAELRRFAYGVEWELKGMIQAALVSYLHSMCQQSSSDCPNEWRKGRRS